MKEYLEKDESGNYVLISAYRKEGNDWIEVPDGAEAFNTGEIFYKDDGFTFHNGFDWMNAIYRYGNLKLLWQREPKYKEFLNANDNYNLVMLPEHAGDDERSGLIEVPEGAIALVTYDSNSAGYWFNEKNKFKGFGRTSNIGDFGYSDINAEDDFKKYAERVRGSKILWQRYTQTESLPFVDDEVVEIEFTTDIKKYEEFQRDIEKSYNHYFKDVSNLKFIDVYRVLDLFAVEHPCLQHSVKKLLCAGQRGSKNRDKDIQEAIDSLLRYQEMRSEDNQ